MPLQQSILHSMACSSRLHRCMLSDIPARAQGSQKAFGKEGLQLACDLGGCQLSAQVGQASYQVSARLLVQTGQVQAFQRSTVPEST